jgi:hypothetical protein
VIVIFFSANCFLMYDCDGTCYETESKTSVWNMATNSQVSPCKISIGVWLHVAGLYKLLKHMKAMVLESKGSMPLQ